MSHPDGNVGGDGYYPGQEYQDFGIWDCAYCQRGDGEDNSKEPVPGHEHQGVDGDIGGDVDDELDSPAPEESKGPVHEDIVTGSEGDTHKDEEEISNSQVEDEQVGGVLHLRVGIHLGKNNIFISSGKSRI